MSDIKRLIEVIALIVKDVISVFTGEYKKDDDEENNDKKDDKKDDEENK